MQWTRGSLVLFSKLLVFFCIFRSFFSLGIFCIDCLFLIGYVSGFHCLCWKECRIHSWRGLQFRPHGWVRGCFFPFFFHQICFCVFDWAEQFLFRQEFLFTVPFTPGLLLITEKTQKTLTGNPFIFQNLKKHKSESKKVLKELCNVLKDRSAEMKERELTAMAESRNVTKEQVRIRKSPPPHPPTPMRFGFLRENPTAEVNNKLRARFLGAVSASFSAQFLRRLNLWTSGFVRLANCVWTLPNKFLRVCSSCSSGEFANCPPPLAFWCSFGVIFGTIFAPFEPLNLRICSTLQMRVNASQQFSSRLFTVFSKKKSCDSVDLFSDPARGRSVGGRRDVIGSPGNRRWRNTAGISTHVHVCGWQEVFERAPCAAEKLAELPNHHWGWGEEWNWIWHWYWWLTCV